MALALTIELRLEERNPNSVLVSVLLAPSSGSTRIDGVALQLFTRQGEALSSRMLLPISGELAQPMLSTLELQAQADVIPQGCRVQGMAWNGKDQVEAYIPTDPFTELEVHMRGRRRIDPDEDDRLLEWVLPEEREKVSRDFPWVNEPRLPVATDALQVVDHEEDEEEALDEVLDELGIDAESAEWLKDLMEDEEGT
ncbi:MAG: hypothetical protein KTR31_06180 [Myxococcales bacterium]|nr:hypothetical protein [Myxococcales bacterium]